MGNVEYHPVTSCKVHIFVAVPQLRPRLPRPDQRPDEHGARRQDRQHQDGPVAESLRILDELEG